MDDLKSEKSTTRKIVDKAAKKVAVKIVKRLLIGLFNLVGWPAILTVLLFTILLAPALGATSAVYNFLSSPRVNIESDQRLKSLYDEVSISTVDVSDDPGMAMYRVPWYLFAAIDKVKNNCEEPEPDEYVDLLKPIIKTKDSIIETETTVIDSDDGTTVTKDITPVSLVDTVKTFKGTYTHNYVSSTTTTSKTITVTRSYTREDGTRGTYKATITTIVSVTKDILYNIQEPMPPDYSRLISALESFDITYKSDQDLIWELSRKYSGQDVDLTQPVNFLMGFDGTGGISMGSGAAPPTSWLPWFKAAAERYHGTTPVAQFEALLMAIAFTESSFSESPSMISSANAKGPFQFTDGTWYDYGIRQLGYAVDDVWIASKAVMGTALMVSKAGAANGDLGGIRAALWRYNQSTEYGNLVMGRMFFYGTFTGWVPDANSALLPGSPSTQGYYWPVPNNNRISCAFGPRIHPVTGQAGYHTGIDIAASLNTPIISPKDGVVEIFNTNSAAYGYYLVVSHGDHVETMYGHIQDVAPGIIEGAKVRAGQVIGYVGTRGLSTGPHLHFEVHYQGSPVNPMLFINQPQ